MYDPNNILTWSDGMPVLNSAGQTVPRTCFCGSRVHLEFHGEPVLICIDHGHYWGTLKCRDNPTVEVNKMTYGSISKLLEEIRIGIANDMYTESQIDEGLKTAREIIKDKAKTCEMCKYSHQAIFDESKKYVVPCDFCIRYKGGRLDMYAE